MSIEIRSVSPDRKELKKYVKFGIDLYRGNDCYVPPLIFEEIETLMPSKNPAFDFCEAQSFMALRDGVPAGRITAIINRVVNERTGKREAVSVSLISSTMRKWSMRCFVRPRSGAVSVA